MNHSYDSLAHANPPWPAKPPESFKGLKNTCPNLPKDPPLWHPLIASRGFKRPTGRPERRLAGRYSHLPEVFYIPPRSVVVLRTTTLTQRGGEKCWDSRCCPAARSFVGPRWRRKVLRRHGAQSVARRQCSLTFAASLPPPQLALAASLLPLRCTSPLPKRH